MKSFRFRSIDEVPEVEAEPTLIAPWQKNKKRPAAHRASRGVRRPTTRVHEADKIAAEEVYENGVSAGRPDSAPAAGSNALLSSHRSQCAADVFATDVCNVTMRASTAIERTEAWVREAVAQHDSSHDFWHIKRVWSMAVKLANEEGIQAADREVVELASLLHDVLDHKYARQPEQEAAALHAFLDTLDLSQQQRKDVLYIIANVGFSEELAQRQAAAAAITPNSSSQQEGRQQAGSATVEEPEAGAGPGAAAEVEADAEAARLQRLLAVVQDADRLDALGAIGIARCFTFGGSKGRVLHDPAVPPRQQLTKEVYQDRAFQQTTINHFFEKLLKLKDLMKTAAGRRAAEGRHRFMEQYLQQFFAEWGAAA